MSSSRFAVGQYSARYVTDNMLLIERDHAPLDTSRKYGIICTHGHGQGAENYMPIESAFGPGAHAQRLADAGFTVLAVDHARVNSWGDPDSMRALDDAYTYLTTTLGCLPTIGMMAYSMGGLVALNWIKRNPGKVDAVWLWAPATDLDYFHSTSGYTPAYGVAVPNNSGWTSEIDAAYGSTVTPSGSVTVNPSPTTVTVPLVAEAVGATPAKNRVVPSGLRGRWSGLGLAQGATIAAGSAGFGDTAVEATALGTGGTLTVDHVGLYGTKIKVVEGTTGGAHVSWRLASLGAMDSPSVSVMFTTPTPTATTAFPFISGYSANNSVKQWVVELVNTSGFLRIKDSTGTTRATSLTGLATGTEYRVEAQLNSQTLTVTAYVGDSTTVAAFVTYPAMVLTDTTDSIRIGSWQGSPVSFTSWYGDIVIANGGAPIGPNFPQGQPSVWMTAVGTGDRLIYQDADDTHLYGVASVSGIKFVSNATPLLSRYDEQAPGSKVRDEYPSWQFQVEEYLEDAVVAAGDASTSYWRLDESGAITAFVDDIANRDAVLVGTAGTDYVLGVPGLLGRNDDGALQILTTAGYAQVSTPGVYGTTFTLEAWVMLNASPPARHHTVFGLFGDASHRLSVVARRNATGNKFSVWSSNGSTWVESTATLTVGVPHHIVVVIHGGLVDFYVDGVLVTAGASFPLPTGVDLATTYLGWSGSTTETYAGVLDSAAIYPGIALTPQQVRYNYAAGVDAPRPGVAMYLVQGDADTVVPPAMNFDANGFLAQVNDPNIIGRQVGGGAGSHTNVFGFVTYDEVIDFFRAALGRPYPTWADLAGLTWADLASTTWRDLGALA